jgi:hypothetical protein
MQNRFQRVSIKTRYSNYRPLANQGQVALSSVLSTYDVTAILFGCHQTEENDQRVKPTGDAAAAAGKALSCCQSNNRWLIHVYV